MPDEVVAQALGALAKVSERRASELAALLSTRSRRPNDLAARAAALLRAAAQRLQRDDPEPGQVLAVRAPASGHLDVARDGAWFVMDGGARVELARRRALRLVLARLVEARQTRPGVPLSAEHVLAAGWPDERILVLAGQARVRSAIAELRRLGLRSAIQTASEGYCLASSLEVRVATDGDG